MIYFKINNKFYNNSQLKELKKEYPLIKWYAINRVIHNTLKNE